MPKNIKSTARVNAWRERNADLYKSNQRKYAKRRYDFHMISRELRNIDPSIFQ